MFNRENAWCQGPNWSHKFHFVRRLLHRPLQLIEDVWGYLALGAKMVHRGWEADRWRLAFMQLLRCVLPSSGE